GGSKGTPDFRPVAASPSKPVEPAAPAPQAKVEAGAAAAPRVPVSAPPPLVPRPRGSAQERGENYYDTKSQVFSALIDTIDLSQLAKLDPDTAREEIRDIVNDIIAIKNFAMSIAEQEELLEDI